MKKTLIFLFVFLLMSCIYDYSMYTYKEGIASSGEGVSRNWTIMLYMASDNSLESEAILDINEIESIGLQKYGITVLALIDRAEKYDETNGNWTDTRLLEISHDTSGENSVLVSKELSSRELGLEKGLATELDMANPNTLKSFLQFGYAHYKAEHYALIMWGHGNGWRSITTDIYSNTSMHLNDFREAINLGVKGNELDLIGLDTSFGFTLETLWQLRDITKHFAGSYSTLSSSGWDYKEVFKIFIKTELIPTDLLSSFLSQRNTSIIDMRHLNTVYSNFDELSQNIANVIDLREKQDAMLTMLLSQVRLYKASTFPSDAFIDMYDFTHVVSSNVNLLTDDEVMKNKIKSKCEDLQNTLIESVHTSSTDGKMPSISVFIIPFISEKVVDPVIPDSYVKTENNENKISFVNDSLGWVPTKNAQSSLLDKLFFYSF